MSNAGLLELLPPELRNKIYALVLVEEGSIKIDKYENGAQRYRTSDGKRKQRKAVGEAVIRGHHRNSKHRGQSYNPATKAWEPASSTNTLALLCVNKRIHVEASTIFFGSNKFELRCWSTLERFLDQIGSGGQHLRSISLTVGGSTTFRTARRATRALSATKDLRTLEVSHFDFCASSPTEEEEKLDALMDTCEPLLQSLRASYTAKGLTADAVDVIKIVLPQNPRCTSCEPHPWRAPRFNCRRLGTATVSFTSSQWKAFCASFDPNGGHFGKVIHCECAHMGADQKNQALNGILKAKVAAKLEEKLELSEQAPKQVATQLPVGA